jgi:hypothetical protein
VKLLRKFPNELSVPAVFLSLSAFLVFYQYDRTNEEENIQGANDDREGIHNDRFSELADQLTQEQCQIS